MIGCIFVLVALCGLLKSQKEINLSKRRSFIDRVEPVNARNPYLDRYESKLNRFSSSSSYGTIEDFIRRPTRYKKKKNKRH